MGRFLHATVRATEKWSHGLLHCSVLKNDVLLHYRWDNILLMINSRNWVHIASVVGDKHEPISRHKCWFWYICSLLWNAVTRTHIYALYPSPTLLYLPRSRALFTILPYNRSAPHPPSHILYAKQMYHIGPKGCITNPIIVHFRLCINTSVKMHSTISRLHQTKPCPLIRFGQCANFTFRYFPASDSAN